MQAGVTLEQLDHALEAYNMMLGVDIPSRGSCSLGGAAAIGAIVFLDSVNDGGNVHCSVRQSMGWRRGSVQRL